MLLQQAAEQEATQQHQQPAGGLIAGIAELTGLHWGQQRPSVFSTGVAPDWWPLSQASHCWDRATIAAAEVHQCRDCQCRRLLIPPEPLQL